jgi:hypothetical protein
MDVMGAEELSPLYVFFTGQLKRLRVKIVTARC